MHYCLLALDSSIYLGNSTWMKELLKLVQHLLPMFTNSKGQTCFIWPWAPLLLPGWIVVNFVHLYNEDIMKRHWNLSFLRETLVVISDHLETTSHPMRMICTRDIKVSSQRLLPLGHCCSQSNGEVNVFPFSSFYE